MRLPSQTCRRLKEANAACGEDSINEISRQQTPQLIIVCVSPPQASSSSSSSGSGGGGGDGGSSNGGVITLRGRAGLSRYDTEYWPFIILTSRPLELTDN